MAITIKHWVWPWTVFSEWGINTSHGSTIKQFRSVGDWDIQLFLTYQFLLYPRNPRGLFHEITIKSQQMCQMSCLNHGKSPLSQVKSPLSQDDDGCVMSYRQLQEVNAGNAGNGSIKHQDFFIVTIRINFCLVLKNMFIHTYRGYFTRLILYDIGINY